MTIVLAGLAILASACNEVTPPSPTTSTTQPAPGPTVSTTLHTDTDIPDGLEFDDYLEFSYRLLLSRSPETLTTLGISDEFGEADDRLDDLSTEYIRETQDIEFSTLEGLREFDRSLLDADQQVSYDVYEWYLETRIGGHQYTYHDWPIHYFVNSYNTSLMGFLTDVHPLDDLTDAEAYISRVGQVRRQVDQVLTNLDTAVSMGVIPPEVIIDRTVGTLASDLGGGSIAAISPTSVPLYRSFETRLRELDLDPATEAELLVSLSAALESSFIPAWVDLWDFMVDLRDQSSDIPGAWRLPDGDGFYEHLLRWHTSTDLSPDEVHELGLAQVTRVQGELRSAFSDLGHPADTPLPELMAWARDTAGFMSGEETILATNYELITRAEEVMRPLFGLWPEAPVEVVADPRGGGYYSAASVDGSRPGRYYANGRAQVPLLSTPTINFHEVTPGHHTQISIAQELDLPLFRRYIRHNAYVEGWALYAEKLAGEQGLYQSDALGDIGRLQLELLRAVRLVVDTGIHARQWSRNEALTYMEEVIPDWTHEVDRYTALPGQATGYMIGMLAILDLREEVVGSRGVELAEFHDRVLGSGSLPLTILDSVVAP